MIELKFNSQGDETLFFVDLVNLGPQYGIKLAYTRRDADEKVYYDGCENTLVIDSEGVVRVGEDIRNLVRSEE